MELTSFSKSHPHREFHSHGSHGPHPPAVHLVPHAASNITVVQETERFVDI